MKWLYRIRNVYRRLTGPYPPFPPPEQLYDQFCRRLAADVELNLPEFGGVFRLDPRSHLCRRIVLTGGYEPHLVELLSALAGLGGDVVDLGANVGFFSVLMSQQPKVGRVLAVEPVDATLDRLRANLSRNAPDGKVIVYAGAALDAAGEISIQIPIGNEEFASSGAMTHVALTRMPDLQYRTFRAPTTTLDALVEKYELSPRLIKVDTEGAEHRVFRGALETLRRFHPAIVTELNDKQLRDNGSSAREVLQMIVDCGYTAYDPATREPSEAVRDYGEALFLATHDAGQHAVLDALRQHRR